MNDPTAIAVKVLAVWFLATATLIGTSAWCAKQKPRDIPVWVTLLAGLSGKFSIGFSGLAPVPAFFALYPERNASTIVVLGFTAAGMACLYGNSILIQVLQNFSYRMVGAKQQKIMWWAGSSESRRRRARRPTK